MNSIEYFKRWFVNPIEKLKELPEGDGGFAALMIVIPLYERYIIGKLKLAGQGTDEDAIKKEVSKDLKMDDKQRAIFWDMFRVGFMHQGMPKKGKTKWMTNCSFPAIPEFKKIDNTDYIRFDPWKFCDYVLNKFKEEPDLISVSESFPLASIFAMSDIIKDNNSPNASGDTPPLE